MKTFLMKFVCRLLIVTCVAMPFSAQTQAAVIATGEAIAASQGAQPERERIRAFMSRPEVRDQLRDQLAARGLSASVASARVDALSDEEARQLAGRIDSLPAGGDLGLAIFVALIVLLVVVLVQVMDRKK